MWSQKSKTSALISVNSQTAPWSKGFTIFLNNEIADRCLIGNRKQNDGTDSTHTMLFEVACCDLNYQHLFCIGFRDCIMKSILGN